MEERLAAPDLAALPNRRQTPKSSPAKLPRLRAVLLSLRPSPLLLVSSHRQPDVGEQLIVARRADAGPAELFVPGVLQPDPRVKPRPARREAADERNVGDFGNPSLGVRGQKRTAPSVEILPGQHHAIVVAIGQRGVGPRFAELVGKGA